MDNFKPSSKIIGVQFSILSPEEIRKNSVVEVVSRDTYINNKPVINLIHASLLNHYWAYEVLMDLREHNPTAEFKMVKVKA